MCKIYLLLMNNLLTLSYLEMIKIIKNKLNKNEKQYANKL